MVKSMSMGSISIGSGRSSPRSTPAPPADDRLQLARENLRNALSARKTADAAGKLSDDAIRALCDGQFMVVTPGRPPTFCALDDASSYSDGALSAKHCLDRRYHTRGEYSRYANASAAAHHGLAPVRKTSVLPAGAFSLCSRWPSR